MYPHCWRCAPLSIHGKADRATRGTSHLCSARSSRRELLADFDDAADYCKTLRVGGGDSEGHVTGDYDDNILDEAVTITRDLYPQLETFVASQPCGKSPIAINGLIGIGTHQLLRVHARACCTHFPNGTISPASETGRTVRRPPSAE